MAWASCGVPEAPLPVPTWTPQTLLTKSLTKRSPEKDARAPRMVAKTLPIELVGERVRVAAVLGLPGTGDR